MWSQHNLRFGGTAKDLESSIDESISLLSGSIVSLKSLSYVKFKYLIPMLNGLDCCKVGCLLLQNLATGALALIMVH
jgi:hypothetical protein